MRRWNAAPHTDYDDDQRITLKGPTEPAPIIQSPSWWQAEYQRIAEATAALAVIRAERQSKGRGVPDA